LIPQVLLIRAKNVLQRPWHIEDGFHLYDLFIASVKRPSEQTSPSRSQEINATLGRRHFSREEFNGCRTVWVWLRQQSLSQLAKNVLNRR
jgi:hypothetical protein